MKWKNAKTDLPTHEDYDLNGCVLAWAISASRLERKLHAKYQHSLAYYSAEINAWLDASTGYALHVLHWQRLPEPPRGDCS